MMKKAITTTIGTINLNDISFVEDTIDIFIGIDSVSEDIQKKINEAVEIAKAEHIQRVKEHFTNKNLNWTDAGVTPIYLYILSLRIKSFHIGLKLILMTRKTIEFGQVQALTLIYQSIRTN